MFFRLLILSSIISFSCSHSAKETNNTLSSSPSNYSSESLNHPKTKNYNFTSPSEIYVLDNKLDEISGLTYDHANNQLITNNDESGYFYTLSITDMSITAKTKFAKKGDFESIEKIGDDIIICKNSGKLYFFNQKTNKTTTYKTPLSLENDVEGMGYLQSENTLLLACKGQPLNTKKGKKSTKSIYAFQISTKTLDKNPYLTISDKSLIDHIEQAYPSISKSDFKNLKNRVKDFSPSALAVHPSSSSVYISSARGSTLVIYDQYKNLKEIIFLDEKIIPQPEGLAFDFKKNLYIATEGQGFNGKIYKFNYH